MTCTVRVGNGTPWKKGDVRIGTTVCLSSINLNLIRERWPTSTTGVDISLRVFISRGNWETLPLLQWRRVMNYWLITRWLQDRYALDSSRPTPGDTQRHANVFSAFGSVAHMWRSRRWGNLSPASCDLWRSTMPDGQGQLLAIGKFCADDGQCSLQFAFRSLWVSSRSGLLVVSYTDCPLCMRIEGVDPQLFTPYGVLWDNWYLWSTSINLSI